MNPILLTSIDFVSGQPRSGLVNVSPRTPSGKLIYVKHFMFRLVHSITGAATSDAIAQRQYCGALAQVAVRDRNGGYIGSRGPVKCSLLRALRQIVQDELLTKEDASATGANANGTNVKESHFVMPFWFNKAKKPGEHCPLLSTIQQIDVTWAAATLFGTGNTLNAAGASYLEVYALPLIEDQLSQYPRLIYHEEAMDKFLNAVLNIDGKVLALGMFDAAAGATTTFGATDFTQYDLAGSDGISCPRQKINAATIAQNCFCAEQLAAYALPDSGNADVIPLVALSPGFALEDLPMERAVSLNLVVGAGTPAVADQELYYVSSMPFDQVAWAQNVGKSPNVDVSQQSAAAAASAVRQVPVMGARGQVISQGHPMAGFARKPVNLKIATGRS